MKRLNEVEQEGGVREDVSRNKTGLKAYIRNVR